MSKSLDDLLVSHETAKKALETFYKLQEECILNVFRTLWTNETFYDIDVNKIQIKIIHSFIKSDYNSCIVKIGYTNSYSFVSQFKIEIHTRPSKVEKLAYTQYDEEYNELFYKQIYGSNIILMYCCNVDLSDVGTKQIKEICDAIIDVLNKTTL
jgi:hypothetical protein